MSDEKHRGLRTRTVVIGAVILIVCGITAMLGMVFVRGHRQRAAVAALTKSGADVRYEDEFQEVSDLQGRAEEVLGIDIFRDVDSVEVVNGTGQELQRIEDLPAIKAILFKWCYVPPAGIEHLVTATQLKSLEFQSCTLGGTDLNRLTGLSHLEFLAMSDPIGCRGRFEFLRRLPQLKTLVLIHTEINDDDLAVLESLTSLERLVLRNSWLTGPGLVHLKNLDSLTTLDLSGCPISDAGLAPLAELIQLVYLDLSWTRITDKSLMHLHKLKNLKRLDLSHTEVLDSGLDLMSDVLSLELLELNDSRLTQYSGMAIDPDTRRPEGNGPHSYLESGSAKVIELPAWDE